MPKVLIADALSPRAAEILAIWRPRLLRRMEALGIEGESQGSGDPEG